MNCKANLHLLRKALPTFNANQDGGVFLLTSSVAGVAASGSSMAYSVTKAAGWKPSAHGNCTSLIERQVCVCLIRTYMLLHVPKRDPSKEARNTDLCSRCSSREGFWRELLTAKPLADLVKCLAATQGPKVRVNAILPGLLLTEWVSFIYDFVSLKLIFVKGANFTPEKIQSSKDKAYLGMEVG